MLSLNEGVGGDYFYTNPDMFRSSYNTGAMKQAHVQRYMKGKYNSIHTVSHESKSQLSLKGSKPNHGIIQLVSYRNNLQSNNVLSSIQVQVNQSSYQSCYNCFYLLQFIPQNDEIKSEMNAQSYLFFWFYVLPSYVLLW